MQHEVDQKNAEFLPLPCSYLLSSLKETLACECSSVIYIYIYKVVATSLLSLITVQNPTPVQKFTRQTRIKSVAGVTHNSQHAWPQTRCLVDGIAMHILNTRQW